MIEDTLHRRGRVASQTPVCLRRRLWQGYVAFCVLLVSSGLLVNGLSAAERARPIRIGALTESWGPTPHIVGMRDGLLELGYREDADFVLGIRFTQGDTAALPAAARELIQNGVALIFAAGPSAAGAAQMATERIPIVFAEVGDPLGLGLIKSFAKPGRNITGVTDLDLELGPKRLEVFREILPGLKRVLFAYNPADAYGAAEASVYRVAARRLGLELVEREVATQEEAQASMAGVRKGEVDGILAPRSLALNIPGFVLEATSQRAIPTMFAFTFFAENGGLASYGPNLYESGRQAARLVDKILKGVKPAEIPVEVNSKLELAINLKVAKALGVQFTPEVLFRADRLIR